MNDWNVRGLKSIRRLIAKLLITKPFKDLQIHTYKQYSSLSRDQIQHIKMLLFQHKTSTVFKTKISFLDYSYRINKCKKKIKKHIVFF